MYIFAWMIVFIFIFLINIACRMEYENKILTPAVVGSGSRCNGSGNIEYAGNLYFSSPERSDSRK